MDPTLGEVGCLWGGPGPSPQPGSWRRSPVAAQLGEESWSRPAGWGDPLLLLTQTFRGAETPSPHFRIEKAFPKQLPDPTASGLDALGGTAAGEGAVGRPWAPSARLMASRAWRAAPRVAGPESSCRASWGLESQSPPRPRSPSGCAAGAHLIPRVVPGCCFPDCSLPLPAPAPAQAGMYSRPHARVEAAPRWDERA